MAEVSVVDSLADALHRLDEFSARDDDQETIIRNALLQALREHTARLPEEVRTLDAAVV